MPAIVILAVVVLVLGAAAALFTVQRNRDTAARRRPPGPRDQGPRRQGPQGRAARPRTPPPPPARRSSWPPPPPARAAPTSRRPRPPRPVAWTPPDEDAMGVTRRQFMNRGIVAGFGLGIGGFAPAVLAFLWPQGSSGFGSKISVGKIADIKSQIEQGNGFLYYPEGRMWITEYPAASLDNARKVYSPVRAGRHGGGAHRPVPEVPAPGLPRAQLRRPRSGSSAAATARSTTASARRRAGPAPRGLDRFAMTVAGGVFTVDTGLIIQGPPIGTNTTGQEAEGPHCISGGAAH